MPGVEFGIQMAGQATPNTHLNPQVDGLPLQSNETPPLIH